jgi:tetratricopeptide (TPR) repeat protein
MIALAYLGKEFITWNRNGRRTHIFNPSGFTLAAVSLALICTGNIDLTYAYDHAVSFYLPPNMYEVIFLFGLVVMYFFSTTLITMGSFAVLAVLYYLTNAAPTLVDVFVLLGLTFLVTDPSTSPRNRWGRFLFGLIYGFGIFVTYVTLRFTRVPAYFDKVLMVPIMNLMTPALDVLGEHIERLVYRPWLPGLRYQWAIYLALYTGIFSIVLPRCKNPPADFRDPLPVAPGDRYPLSSQMIETRAKNFAVHAIYPEAWRPFAFRTEIAHFRDLQDFEPQTALEQDLLGRSFLMLGAMEPALVHFRRAADMDPACVEAHQDLGYVFSLQGRLDLAIQNLDRAATLSPGDGSIHFNLGVALKQQGQLAKAVLHFQQAVDLSPSDGRAWFQLGHTLMLSGREADAAPAFRKALLLPQQSEEARQWPGLPLTLHGTRSGL